MRIIAFLVQWREESFSRRRKVHAVKGWAGSKLGKDEE